MTVKKHISDDERKITFTTEKSSFDDLPEHNISSDFQTISKAECFELLEDLSEQYDEAMRELAK